MVTLLRQSIKVSILNFFNLFLYKTHQMLIVFSSSCVWVMSSSRLKLRDSKKPLLMLPCLRPHPCLISLWSGSFSTSTIHTDVRLCPHSSIHPHLYPSPCPHLPPVLSTLTRTSRSYLSMPLLSLICIHVRAFH